MENETRRKITNSRMAGKITKAVYWLNENKDRVMVCNTKERVQQLQNQFPFCYKQFKTLEEMIKKAQNEVNPIWIIAEDGRAIPKSTEMITDNFKEEICEVCGGDGFIEEYGDGDNFEYDVIAEHPCPNGCAKNVGTDTTPNIKKYKKIKLRK
jgi:hypothetical protein